MMLLEEYSTAMECALTTTYRGQASIGDSARIMAMVGIKGSSTVQHHNLQMETHTLDGNTFFEVGMKTTVRRTVRNDTSQTMQTKSRLYLVSEHLLPGAPLSMMDTRLVAPITEDCALVLHSTLGHYKCVKGGKLTCYKHGDSKRIYTLSKGDSLFLDPRDTCTSTCAQKRHSTGYHKVPPLAPTRMGRGLPRPCANPAEAPSELDTTATLFSLPLASVPSLLLRVSSFLSPF
jgi:hypothetical protein